MKNDSLMSALIVFVIFSFPGLYSQTVPKIQRPEDMAVVYVERNPKPVATLSEKKNGFIAGIPLPSMGNPTRPPKFYGIIETRALGVSVDAIIRCNDPMKCPDPNCKICPNAGIKTCWD